MLHDEMMDGFRNYDGWYEGYLKLARKNTNQWTTQAEGKVIFEHGVVLELVEYPKKFVFTFFQFSCMVMARWMRGNLHSL